MRFVAKNTELLAVLLCSEIEQKKTAQNRYMPYVF